MLDFTKLWDKTYLFGPNPAELSRSDHIYFWLALVFVVAGVVFKIFAAKNHAESPRRHLMNRLFRLSLTVGALILLWTGARFENIPWLSTRFVALVLLLLWAVWLFFIARYFIRQYRSQQRHWEDEAIKRRYLKTSK